MNEREVFMYKALPVLRNAGWTFHVRTQGGLWLDPIGGKAYKTEEAYAVQEKRNARAISS